MILSLLRTTVSCGEMLILNISCQDINVEQSVCNKTYRQSIKILWAILKHNCPNLAKMDCLFIWFLNALVNNWTNCRRVPTLTSNNFTGCHTQDRAGSHFCFSRSHYTDTDPISREPAATEGIEPWTSSLGVARSTD